jgi:putative membrane protein
MLMLLACRQASVSGFTPQRPAPVAVPPTLCATALFAEKQLRPGSLAAATAEQGKVPYGESSRKYRRTIYKHEDWVKHRSSDRLKDNLKGIFVSGVVRQLQSEVLLIMSVAASVVLWNNDLSPYLNMGKVSLSTLPFTLSSPALGLLLVFRTNASYARWMIARTEWGRIISQSKNTVRMASTFVDRTNDNGPELENLSRRLWALSRSTMNTFSGPDDEAEYEEELEKVFSDDPQFVARLLEQPDRASAALMEVSLTLDALPIDEKRRVEIDKSLVIIGDCMGKCDRVYEQPVPLVYTRHTARFLSMWMLMLPFGLYESVNNWILVPSVGILALFLFGIEELAIQLEEPYSILPMKFYCDEILQTTLGMVKWSNTQSTPPTLSEQETN